MFGDIVFFLVFKFFFVFLFFLNFYSLLMLCYAFNLLMAFDRLLLKGLLTYLHMQFILHVISLIVGCRWAILQIFVQLISLKPSIKSIILLFISNFKAYEEVCIGTVKLRFPSFPEMCALFA